MGFLGNLFGGNRTSADPNLNPIGIDMDGLRSTAQAERNQQHPFVFEAYTPERQGLFNGPRGVWGGIGRIGDALAMAGGKEPVYRQFVQEDDARNALGTLAQDPNNQSALAQLARWSPDTLIKYQNAFARKPVEPTTTERTYEFLTRRLGPKQADGYLRSVAMGPPVAVDQVDQVTGRTVRGFYSRGELYGGDGASGGQQITPQPAPAPSSGDPSTILANAISRGSISPEEYGVLGRHWNGDDMKRIDAYLRNNRVARSGAAPAAGASTLPSGFVLD